MACFDGAQEYLVCLHWKCLPKSNGGGVVPSYGGEPARYQGALRRRQHLSWSAPSPHAVEVLAELRVDISKLRSLPLSEELVGEASCIIAMTRSHMESIHYLFPEAAEKTFLLREFEDYAPSLDVSDPIGLGREAYEVTRDIIQSALPGILKFIDSGALDGKFNTDSLTMNQPGNLSLEQVDPAIFQAIQNERKRQLENIELIASENFTSRAVMEAQGSVLTNKYAEGYPGRRWYGGCEYVDVAEQLAIDRPKQLFGAEHVNVQPHSGSQANMAVYFSVLQPGDRIYDGSFPRGTFDPRKQGQFFRSILRGRSLWRKPGDGANRL